MLSGNYNYQHMDWSHAPIQDEDFEHLGNLVTHLITPTISIGLTDYVNISYTQAVGIRSMDWMGSDESSHHRDEHSLSSLLNAKGSIFGDASLLLKYLLTNTGAQAGSRFFLGVGLIIPSNSVLTESPFLTDQEGNALNKHRHFSLSEGCYKTNFEVQYYIKNISKKIYIPAFYGLTLNYMNPIKESDYGYFPGATSTAILSSLFATQSKNTWAPKGISLGIAYVSTELAYWNDNVAQNSETQAIIPSIGLIWNSKDYGSLSINLKYNKDEALPEDALDNKSTSFELSIGYRKALDYIIPWLYF